MKKKILIPVLTALALVLECIPYGARMRWMTPEPEGMRVTWHAYFSLMPFGYGDIFPLCTSVLTAALLLVYLLYLWIGEGGCLLYALSMLAAAASVTALGMQVFLLGYISPIGIAIAALLLFVTVLIYKKEKEQPNG